LWIAADPLEHGIHQSVHRGVISHGKGSVCWTITTGQAITG
jgi:hypothetical protein